MSFTHAKSKSITTSTGQVSKSNNYSAECQIEIDVAIADSETDYEVNIALDVSQVVSFFIVSDQAITLETNDGTTPDDTLSLVADKVYDWDSDSYDNFKLTTDVTNFYFTNASGSTANVQIRVLVDPTP